jgi:hypothetical protein
MIADYVDRDSVLGYVAALREKVAAGGLDDHAARAAYTIGRGASAPREAILATLPEADAGPASSGEGGLNSPFFSRDPAVSLLQTTLEDESRAAGIVEEPKRPGRFGHIGGVVEAIVDDVAARLHPEKFATHDPDWITKIGEATLDRLAKGTHPFNPRPAEYEIDADDARILIVGDWGSGLPHAVDVAALMARQVADALGQGRSVHVIHLGDVYYSGDPVEYERRLLAPGMWPVTAEQAGAGVTSWTLNGNHDMYGGGFGYFETCLGDGRFAKQRSAPDGKPTSFFRIRTPSWDLVGLDTSWDPQVLSRGQQGVLEDPQAAVLAGWAAESPRKQLMLLSHHQLLTAYDHKDLGTVLPYRLQSLLSEKGRIAAWLWGHEHRCMGFVDPEERIGFARCIGHGGIPVPATAPDAAIPAPGVWQTSGSFEDKGASWNRFGFAVLDLDGPRATVSYIDDQGNEAHAPERVA